MSPIPVEVLVTGIQMETNIQHTLKYSYHSVVYPLYSNLQPGMIK